MVVTQLLKIKELIRGSCFFIVKMENHSVCRCNPKKDRNDGRGILQTCDHTQ